MPYIFTTPTVKEGPAGGHRLFDFYTLDRGVTVVRVGENEFEEYRYPSEDELLGLTYWIGGHIHVVDDDMAAELIVGGYEDYLTEITE